MPAAVDESVVATPQPKKPMAPCSAERRCLIVEPDNALLQNYSGALVGAGFDVIASRSVNDVLVDNELSIKVQPAVMLVAVNDYTDYHGPRLQQLQQQLLALRKRWPLSSLIVLADGTPTRWLHALAVDDLLPKIAPLAIIIARCEQAATRFTRRQPNVQNHWCLLAGKVEEQADAGLLRFCGRRPRLTLSEYAVFTRLLKAHGEWQSYAELSRAVGYSADPLSLMALLQALQLRFSSTLNGVVELQHIPHFGYQLKVLTGISVSDETVPLDGQLSTETVQ